MYAAVAVICKFHYFTIAIIFCQFLDEADLTIFELHYGKFMSMKGLIGQLVLSLI